MHTAFRVRMLEDTSKVLQIPLVRGCKTQKAVQPAIKPTEKERAASSNVKRINTRPIIVKYSLVWRLDGRENASAKLNACNQPSQKNSQFDFF